MNYYDDLNGTGGSGAAAIAADKETRLPDVPCRFVQLHNWTVTDATGLATVRESALSSQPKDAADGTELYYGFNGVMSAQLFAGESTPLLPVNNLNQIYARATTGNTGTIRYTYFR